MITQHLRKKRAENVEIRNKMQLNELPNCPFELNVNYFDKNVTEFSSHGSRRKKRTKKRHQI